MQSEDPVDRGNASGRHDIDGAAWHLLGRLEDQPDLAGQRACRGRTGQEQAGTHQDRGAMHIVPARVAGTPVDRPVRYVLLVIYRQRIDIGPERDYPLTGGAIPDVDSEASALGQDGRAQSSSLKPERDPPRRPVLVVASLGMGVQITPKLDELGLVRGEERVEFCLEIVLSHALPPGGQRDILARRAGQLFCASPRRRSVASP